VDLVIGADVGGTSTKVALATPAGRLVAYATGPGGNIRSSPADLGATLRQTLARALAGHDPSHVCASHLGVSGAGPAAVGTVTALCTTALQAAGASGSVEVRTDLDIAFASAATGRSGLLLLAGTGAVACSVEDLETVGRCDGTGWLLGDVGSAVWFGRRALEAAAADLDGRGPATALTSLVLAHHGVDPLDDPRQGLVAAVYPLAVSEHGGLAPLVLAAAATGDLVAQQVVDEGVDALVRTAHAALTDTLGPGRRSRPRRPAELVLAGGLLTARGPIRSEVGRRLALDLDLPPGAVHDALAPVVGALRLAVRAADGPDLAPETLATLRTRVTSWTGAGEVRPQT
jgi:glucosamine kinase